MARRYHAEVDALKKALNEQYSGEAREHVRGLIEKIVLTSKDDEEGLSIDLFGDLAGILQIAVEDKTMTQSQHITKRLNTLIANDNHYIEPSVRLAAGAGF